MLMSAPFLLVALGASGPLMEPAALLSPISHSPERRLFAKVFDKSAEVPPDSDANSVNEARSGQPPGEGRTPNMRDPPHPYKSFLFKKNISDTETNPPLRETVPTWPGLPEPVPTGTGQFKCICYTLPKLNAIQLLKSPFNRTETKMAILRKTRQGLSRMQPPSMQCTGRLCRMPLNLCCSSKLVESTLNSCCTFCKRTKVLFCLRNLSSRPCN